MDDADHRNTGPRGCPDYRAVVLSLGALGFAYGVAALVGLPLYADGAYYFFRLVLDGVPEIPNLRLAAVLPQLPALAATRLTEDVMALRHAFSLGYAALPVLSLLVCWLCVRHAAPALILFPALFLVANQVNLSGVSELLTSLYLAWPFVLLAGLHPHRGITWIYGAALAPLLLLLHPLGFLLLLALAGLAGLNARLHPGTRSIWLGLMAALGTAATLRLLWTLLGANEYERSHGEADEAAYYLMADTPTKALLLMLVLGLGLLLAFALDARGKDRAIWLPRGLSLGIFLLPLTGIALGAGWLAGEGIKLKIGAVYPLSLLLMGLAAILAAPLAARTGTTADTRRQDLPWPPWLAACALAIVVATTAKSAAWWTATHGLMNATASSELDCIPLGPQEPYALQWPWMAIVDNWTAPMSALIFRGPWPVPLLLPKDGCQVLKETGEARIHPWILYPRSELEARFGPLRSPASDAALDVSGQNPGSGLDAHPAAQQAQAVGGKGQDEGQDDTEGKSQGDVAHPVEPIAEPVDHVKDGIRQ